MAGYKRAKGLSVWVGELGRRGEGGVVGEGEAVWVDRGVDRMTSRLWFQNNSFLVIKEHNQNQHESQITIWIVRSKFHQFGFPALCSSWFCEMTFRKMVVTHINLTVTFQDFRKTGLFSDFSLFSVIDNAFSVVWLSRQNIQHSHYVSMLYI